MPSGSTRPASQARSAPESVAELIAACSAASCSVGAGLGAASTLASVAAWTRRSAAAGSALSGTTFAEHPGQRVEDRVVAVLDGQPGLQQVEHVGGVDRGVVEGAADVVPDRRPAAGCRRSAGSSALRRRRPWWRRAGPARRCPRRGRAAPRRPSGASYGVSGRGHAQRRDLPGATGRGAAPPGRRARGRRGGPPGECGARTPASRSSTMVSGPAVRSQLSVNDERSPAPACSQLANRSCMVALPKRCRVKWSMAPAKKTSSPRRALSCLRMLEPLA